jgi:hypothetical protein
MSQKRSSRRGLAHPKRPLDSSLSSDGSHNSQSDSAAQSSECRGLGHLTRPQRRRLERVVAEVDQHLDTDRRFFERRPDRQHRVRRAFAAEIAVFEIVEDIHLETPAGHVWFVAVKHIAPSVRARALFTTRASAETDLNEATAAALFRAVLPDGANEIPGLAPSTPKAK